MNCFSNHWIILSQHPTVTFMKQGNRVVRDYMRNARILRELFGFSQAYVAFKLGVSQSLYCKAENGQIRPTINLIVDICSLYNINIADFLELAKNDLVDQMLNSKVFIALAKSRS